MGGGDGKPVPFRISSGDAPELSRKVSRANLSLSNVHFKRAVGGVLMSLLG